MLEKIITGIWLAFFMVVAVVFIGSLFIPLNMVLVSGLLEIVFGAFFVAMVITFVVDTMEARK